MKQLKYWIKRYKRLWEITKRHIVRWKDDLRWEISHPEFYAKRISQQTQLQEPLENPYVTPPLDPRAYPFDQKKADKAYAEVGRWINEDEMKNKAEKND